MSPGGSSTVHIYTQILHRTTQNKQYIEQHNNLGKCGPCPVLANCTLAFALQLRKKHGKTSVTVVLNANSTWCSQAVTQPSTNHGLNTTIDLIKYEGWNFNIYLQLIQNRYTFRSFTVLQCSHQHCVQPVVSDVEVVGYL